ncbi:MAG: hypothetical protein Q9N32_07550 [Gammaproteobacteria bacterium]|nr:hypothetical protein [Gammaproteobacteria bacterium]
MLSNALKRAYRKIFRITLEDRNVMVQKKGREYDFLNVGVKANGSVSVKIITAQEEGCGSEIPCE